MLKFSKIFCLSSIGLIVIAFLLMFWLIPEFSYADLPNWIGCDAEPAESNDNTTNLFTYLYDEQATDQGQIDSAEINLAYSEAGAVVQFAVFENTGGTTFRDITRTEELAVTVESGLNKYKFDANSVMLIDVGDYVGFYLKDDGVCTMEKETSGGGGYHFYSGDAIDSTESDVTFTLSGNSTHDIQFRLYITATGEEEEAIPARRRRFHGMSIEWPETIDSALMVDYGFEFYDDLTAESSYVMYDKWDVAYDTGSIYIITPMKWYDVNRDNKINILDVTRWIQYVYKGY